MFLSLAYLLLTLFPCLCTATATITTTPANRPGRAGVPVPAKVSAHPRGGRGSLGSARAGPGEAILLGAAPPQDRAGIVREAGGLQPAERWVGFLVGWRGH